MRNTLILLGLGLLLTACIQQDIPARERLSLSSPAFSHGDPIPYLYTCDGDDLSPPLHVTNIPEGTERLALIMDDPDAPRPTPWVHWVMWNIDPSEGVLDPSTGIEGFNTRNEAGYKGPCPPVEDSSHRYYFRLFALESVLDLPERTNKEKLLEAIQGKILEETILMGRYSRTND